MKRTRADAAAISKPQDNDPPHKAPRRSRDSTPQAGNAKPSKPKPGERRRAAASAAGEVGHAVQAVEVGPEVEWDPLGDLGGWWTWGVEEEKLQGWFPFVEEDFLRFLGLDLEEEMEVLGFDDIWRIHQIYEIPGSAK